MSSIILWDLFFIFLSLIVDLFVHINWISVHWYWNLSSGMLETFLWDVSKAAIGICFPYMFVGGLGEGYGWVFRLVHINWFLFLIQNLLQVIRSIIFMLIFDMCISYLLVHRPLILKLVLGCVRNFSVRRIFLFSSGHRV